MLMQFVHLVMTSTTELQANHPKRMLHIQRNHDQPVTHGDKDKDKQKSRKRAADFLSDDEDDGAPVQGKASKNKIAKKADKNSKNGGEKATPASKDADSTEKVKKPPMKKGKSKSARAAESAEKLLSTPVSEWPKKGSKKKAQQASKEDQTLTADGVNGVVEQPAKEDVETIAKKDAVNTSMQAEAQRTVDQELEDEWGNDDEPDDQGPALLAGFDSDSEDEAEDTDMKKDKPLPQLHRNAQKALQKLSKKTVTDGQTPDSDPGTVYVGRVPHGFYEREMREYFSQFGTITKLRLSRNKRTGASKHFAFIQFEDKEVAQIVANTMDNYLLFGHILKCKFAPEESLHKDVWKGANKRYRKIPHQKLEKQKLEAPMTTEHWSKKVRNEQKKREKQAKLLKEKMGYEIELPKMSDPEEVLEKRKLAEAEAQGQKKLVSEGHEVDAPTGAIEPPKGRPKDEVAIKAAKKNSEKSKKVVSSDADASAGDDNPSKELPKDDVAVKASKKKSKKGAGGEVDVLADGDKERAEDENAAKASKKESKKSKKADASGDALAPPKSFPEDEAAAKAGKKKAKKSRSADDESVSKKRKSADEPEPKGILKKSKKA